MSAKQRIPARSAAAAASSNGQPDPLAAAMASEDAIAAEAAELRKDAKDLTPELFMQLWPLLRKKIPDGFIVTTPAVKGKPYDSTGVKSLQVLIDRMDNVLSPLWWGWRVDYVGPEGLDDQGHPKQGKLAKVTVYVGDPDAPLVSRESYGGMNQASTAGNLFKGTETNAAKRAFAAIGPAHEVYLGATDYEPDVDPDAAKQQERADAPAAIDTVSADDAARLRDLFDEIGCDAGKLKVKLGSMGVTGASSVNQALASLTPAQAAELDGWLTSQREGGDES